MKVGQTVMKCTEKKGFPGFEFPRQDESGASYGKRRLLKKKLYFGGSKVGGWVYNTAEAGAMENSGQYSSGQQK